jgi:GNAT superfamily N-acetyltransferase
VAELMVAPAHRRRGVGCSLLSRYVEGHPRAWLATHPEAEAVALYESQGWIRRAAYSVGELPLVLFTREAAQSRESACLADRPLSQAPPAGRPPSRRI